MSEKNPNVSLNGIKNGIHKEMENENPFIIKMPDVPEPNSFGLGWDMFHAMKNHGENIAQHIGDTHETDTFEDLLQRCIRTAIVLNDEDGITEDDIICTCSDNHKNAVVPFIASQFRGAKTTAIDPTMSKDEIRHMLKIVTPKIIFVIPEAIDKVEEAIEEAMLDVKIKIVSFGTNRSERNEIFDYYLEEQYEEHAYQPVKIQNLRTTAAILYSSGTTGFPKGICLSHYALLAQCITPELLGKPLYNVFGIYLTYQTMYWITGMYFVIMATIYGLPRLLVRQFDTDRIWKLIEYYKVPGMVLTPRQFIDILKSGKPPNADISSIRNLMTVGSTMPLKYIIQLKQMFPQVVFRQGYGQTEVAGGIFSYFDEDSPNGTKLSEEKPESCGTPMKGFWYKIVDPDTEEVLGPNQKGELRLKSRQKMMNGYHNEDSSEAFDSDGWLKSGDIFYYDEEQCFYIVSRIKELLKYRNIHVVPAVLETILLSHPAVHSAVVIGKPHEEDGEHPMGLIILNSGFEDTTKEEIQSYANSKLSDRQQLRGGITFVKGFPMTPTGKVRRSALRELYCK